MKQCILTLLFICMPIINYLPQDFSGSYILIDYNDQINLTLAENEHGIITGALSSEGIEYSLKGKQQANKVIGKLEGLDEHVNFVAKIIDNQLHFTLYEPGVDPDEYGETWVFDKSGETTSNRQGDETKVVINGNVLTDEQISELEKIYSVKPLPGNYWYDSNSGLYGVVGYPAYGFMLAGHDFGEMDSDASNGDVGVFVNGRQLPQLEWAVWSQLLGYIIQPGRYWLDENGNAGYEGNPIPTENLYLAAQRNYYNSSGSGGGDNIWSSRFGAGNYDSNNQRGYVSVPGYGPVGYGF